MEATLHNSIPVERDEAGLQIAVRELFEESFVQDSLKSILAKVEDGEMRARILEDVPVRTLSPGYYDRAAYLLDLGSAMEAGVQYTASTLVRGDVIGLQAVKRAKAEFECDHPSCGACGTRQDNRFMRECKKCRAKFAGRGD